MYEKEQIVSFRYNDPEDKDLSKILDPKHTALLMIDMQNDFCSPKGKFAQAGRDCSATEKKARFLSAYLQIQDISP